MIREFVVHVTRPQQGFDALAPAKAAEYVRAFERIFRIADETSAVTHKMLELITTYPTGGRQVHDAKIVATMLVNEIKTLATIIVEDMRRFESVITLLPLLKTS